MRRVLMHKCEDLSSALQHLGKRPSVAKEEEERQETSSEVFCKPPCSVCSCIYSPWENHNPKG